MKSSEMIKKDREDMNIVIVGHVDHGKSTLMGRLLADTASLPEGKLEQVKENCRQNSKPFEYAFLLDALQDEQSQGITIDTARCFFKTKKRNYIILDAPGHIEFLKNMITGAARAQAAVLLIDAKEGVQENSRRHAFMLSMLGIHQIAVVINKMDLVGYSETVYERVKTEYLSFLQEIDMKPKFVLPASAFQGENIVESSKKMPWYQGKSILQVLDSFECEHELEKKPFRMPLQDIYKFTEEGDDRRIFAGTVETGSVRPGDEIIFYPSEKRSHIRSMETFHAKPPEKALPEMAMSFTLKEQIYVKRGEIMCKAGEEKPKTASLFSVNLFWLGREKMSREKKYFLKLGTERCGVRLREIKSVLDSSNLKTEKKEWIERNEVAQCILETDRVIAFDEVTHIAGTSRFVIVDNYEIAGGGIITASLEDDFMGLKAQNSLRNFKWQLSEVTPEERSESYRQRPLLLFLTGEKGAGKKELARRLEKELLGQERFVYFLGMGTYLYSVGRDIKDNHDEQIKRLAELINIMLDSGMILVMTARSLTARDRRIMDTVVDREIRYIWVGEKRTTDVSVDLSVSGKENEKDTERIIRQLEEEGFLFV